MSKQTVADIPSYYTGFSCKCGECRSVCCHGWGISLSMPEYFRLVGLNVKKELRRRLDGAFFIADDPTDERYALVCETPDGYCPLLDVDGYCSLQRGCGERVLPFVCRTYPRAYRMGSDGVPECMCSGSCEKTVEMLIDMPSPLRFVRENVSLPDETVDILYSPGACITDDTEKMFKCLEIFGNAKGLSVEDRLRLLAPSVGGDACVLDMWLPRAISVMRHFARTGTLSSEYCSSALACLGASGEKYSILYSSVNYARARKTFDALLPDATEWYVNLCMNHMFYSQFPSEKLDGSDAKSFAALCCAYIFVRTMTVCNVSVSTENPKNAFVDAAAASFRLIEHTDFGRVVRLSERDL